MVAEGATWRRCLGRAERRFFGLPSSGRISSRLPRGAYSAGDELVDGLTLVLVAGALEQIAPRGDVRAPAEQRTPLPLGHPAPDAELDSVVERIRKALRANRASPADQLGAILRCSLDEQLVRVGSLACGACGPVSDPHVPTPLDRRARTHDGRLDGVAIPGRVRAAALPRLSVRDPATYGSPAGMPRPRHGHLPNSSHGLYARRKIVTLWMWSCSRRHTGALLCPQTVT